MDVTVKMFTQSPEKCLRSIWNLVTKAYPKFVTLLSFLIPQKGSLVLMIFFFFFMSGHSKWYETSRYVIEIKFLDECVCYNFRKFKIGILWRDQFFSFGIDFGKNLSKRSDFMKFWIFSKIDVTASNSRDFLK